MYTQRLETKQLPKYCLDGVRRSVHYTDKAQEHSWRHDAFIPQQSLLLCSVIKSRSHKDFTCLAITTYSEEKLQISVKIHASKQHRSLRIEHVLPSQYFTWILWGFFLPLKYFFRKKPNLNVFKQKHYLDGGPIDIEGEGSAILQMSHFTNLRQSSYPCMVAGLLWLEVELGSFTESLWSVSFSVFQGNRKKL